LNSDTKFNRNPLNIFGDKIRAHEDEQTFSKLNESKIKYIMPSQNRCGWGCLKTHPADKAKLLHKNKVYLTFHISRATDASSC